MRLLGLATEYGTQAGPFILCVLQVRLLYFPLGTIQGESGIWGRPQDQPGLLAL